MEKIEKFLIFSAIGIIISYLLVIIGNQGNGLLCSICGLFGHILQFPTSSIDLFLIHCNVDWIILILGILCFANRMIINNQ